MVHALPRLWCANQHSSFILWRGLWLIWLLDLGFWHLDHVPSWCWVLWQSELSAYNFCADWGLWFFSNFSRDSSTACGQSFQIFCITSTNSVHHMFRALHGGNTRWRTCVPAECHASPPAFTSCCSECQWLCQMRLHSLKAVHVDFRRQNR